MSVNIVPSRAANATQTGPYENILDEAVVTGSNISPEDIKRLQAYLNPKAGK